MASTPKSPIRNADLEAQAEDRTSDRCQCSKELFESIMMLILAVAVLAIGVLLLLHGAGGIGSSLFTAFLSGGLAFMNFVFPKSDSKGIKHLSFNAPLFEKTNHVFMRVLAFATCIYGCVWEHGSFQMFVVGCFGSVAYLLIVLPACIVAFYRCFLKCCRRSSQGQPETKEVQESQPDVITSAVERNVEKVQKEKIAKAKTGELDEVQQPEARVGDGDARSLSNLPVVLSQGFAFLQMLGMSLELQLQLPGLEMPSIVRRLAGVLPVFTFEMVDVPVPETAAVVLRVLAPVVLLWCFAVQTALRGAFDFHPVVLIALMIVQLGPWVIFIIVSYVLDATWGVVIGAACFAVIFFIDLVKYVNMRKWGKVKNEAGDWRWGSGTLASDFKEMAMAFDAHVLLLLYGASYLGPLRALAGLYISDAKVPATGWMGIVSGMMFAVCVYIGLLGWIYTDRPDFKSFANHVSEMTNDLWADQKRQKGCMYRRDCYVCRKRKPLGIMALLLVLITLLLLGGHAASVLSLEHAIIAALGALFTFLPLAVFYFWNAFNELGLNLQDPYIENRRLVASLLPLERAVGIGIVELMASQLDRQLVLFFSVVVFFLLLMAVSKPYADLYEDFFNDLALRCSVVVVAAVAIDMRFGFGMAGPREASAIGVSIAGVLWVLVALKPLSIPVSFFANVGSVYDLTMLDKAIANKDIARAAHLFLKLSSKSSDHNSKFTCLSFIQAVSFEAVVDLAYPASGKMQWSPETLPAIDVLHMLMNHRDHDVQYTCRLVLERIVRRFGNPDYRRVYTEPGNEALNELIIQALKKLLTIESLTRDVAEALERIAGGDQTRQ
eukprot:gnl/MRDRNA2_/MRDRNA2_86030_c0_seq4.p1 gnl/MRDRNA2_/MRDRNA2_86030_c0~~gnl/MRDRNA2_/MRDRNA2_86030_c0_seq4.p1  ORF type:complete len:867 (+),score=113.95 gnl/MRDRNA2_/MRDRNA2_86030_c0_seq4:98-2602(+)